MDIRAIIMGVGFAVMWSSAFTSARIIVAHAPPVSALALRHQHRQRPRQPGRVNADGGRDPR